MLRNKFWLILSAIALVVLLIVTCSDDPTGGSGSDDKDKTDFLKDVSFSPNSGTPGTAVLMQNFGTLPEGHSWMLTIGDVPVPMIFVDSQIYITAIPLIFSDTNNSWPITPVAPVSVLLYRDSVVIDSLPNVITIEELQRADWAMDSIIYDLTEGVSALKEIAGTSALADSQMQVFLDALDTILVSGENSLTAFINGTAAIQSSDSVPKEIISAISVSSGLCGAISVWSDDIISLNNALKTGKQYGSFKQNNVILSGKDLAFNMQLQAFLKEFGTTFIGQTNATWSEFTTILGLVTIVVPLPGVAQAVVEVISFILNIVEFIINKILIGILPGELTNLELDFQDHMVANGDSTWSIIYISAKNDSVAIGLQDVISQILNATSFANWAGSNGIPRYLMTDTQLLNDIIQSLTTWVLGVVRSIQSSMGLPDISQRIPEITWDSLRVYEPSLMDRMTSNLYLLEPIDSSNNWLASDTLTGWGRLSVQTATGSSAWVHPTLASLGYHGGTFGDEVMSSNIDSVHVVPGLYLDVTFPSSIDSAGSGELWVRAGYERAGQVNYSSGIHIALSVTGGSAQSTWGYTDASGYFSTTVDHDNSSDEIEVSVTASGIEESYAFKQVSANVLGGLLLACANKWARFIDSSYCENCWIVAKFSLSNESDMVKARIYYVYEIIEWPNNFSSWKCWAMVPWEGDGFVFGLNEYTEGNATTCYNKCVEVRFIDAGDDDTCGCTGTIWYHDYPNEPCE